MSAPELTNPFPDDHDDSDHSDSGEEFPTFTHTYLQNPLSGSNTGPADRVSAVPHEEPQTQPYVLLPSVDPNFTPSLMPLPDFERGDITSSPESYDSELSAQGFRSPGRIPGYRILSFLGQGGSSTVFRGRHLELGIDVAIKIQHFPNLAPNLQDEAVEVRHRLGCLRHPNLVALYGSGMHNQNPFLVMELIEGSPLNHYRHGEPQVERTTLVRLMEQTARGVAFLHRQGILHRDIKPSNILIDTHGRARLADYGLATRWPSPVEMAEGQIVGTPAYMAPEQVTALTHAFGPALDVWAIGSSLYWLLTGVNPFRRNSIQATLQALLTEEAPSLRDAWPEAPPALERVCSRCMRRNPEERYLCADDLADDLLAFLQGAGSVA